MQILKGALFSFFILIVVLILWIGFIRNKDVYTYRNTINNSVLIAQLEDIKKGNKDIEWRRSMFELVGYNEMVLYFWKPFPSFYSSLCFIDEKSTKDNCAVSRGF